MDEQQQKSTLPGASAPCLHRAALPPPVLQAQLPEQQLQPDPGATQQLISCSLDFPPTGLLDSNQSSRENASSP